MMAKPLVTIKGLKDGLVFLLDDKCGFTILLNELHDKLEHAPHFFDGPIVYVDIKLGTRIITDEQRTELLHIFMQQGNLLVRSIESSSGKKVERKGYSIETRAGLVRSGQVLHHEGNLLFLGDVNPGGMIVCTGDVVILGSLRGAVHAGIKGERSAIIAAALFIPTQLRIGEVISRPPDEWGVTQLQMEFAYLQDGAMQIDKIAQLHRVCKDICKGINIFKGV